MTTAMTYHNFEYTSLLLLCFIVPFLYSIIHRRFLIKYHYRIINKSVILAAIPFLIWDIYATASKHWQFNPSFTTQWKLLGLPIEEFLFFIFIPQSCLLIWVAFKRYTNFTQVKTDILNHFNRIKK